MNGIYGKAGTGLQDATWAKNAAVATIGAEHCGRCKPYTNSMGNRVDRDTLHVGLVRTHEGVGRLGG